MWTSSIGTFASRLKCEWEAVSLPNAALLACWYVQGTVNHRALRSLIGAGVVLVVFVFGQRRAKLATQSSMLVEYRGRSAVRTF